MAGFEETANTALQLAQLQVEAPVIPEDRVLRITDFGAAGDGVTRNTAAINRAIAACAEAGGGTVIIPKGMWLTGPIQLQSRIRLHAEKGAVILFTRDQSEYPLITTRWEGNEAVRCMPLLYGEQLEDVALTGEGVYDGNGDAWRPVKKFKKTPMQWDALRQSGGVTDAEGEIWWPDEGGLNGARAIKELQAAGNVNPADYEPYRTFLRPVLLGLHECSRVRLEGPVFQNSPGWNLHLFLCEHMTLRGLQVRNPWYAQNGDGLDLESCRYALVEDCTFDVGDDAICMKSGKNAEGRRLGRPTEEVVIRGCTVFHGHGGFVVGSEMSGGVRNVLVEDCSFIGTDVGLRFKSTRGRGGVVENILIRNVRMKDIHGAAISFNLYYEGKSDGVQPMPVTEETPEFRSIAIEDTVCIGADRALELMGLPEMPLRDLAFRRVLLAARLGVDCRYATALRFDDVQIRNQEGDAWCWTACENVSRADS